MSKVFKILSLAILGASIGWLLYLFFWPQKKKEKKEKLQERGYVDMPNYDKDQTWYDDNEVECDDL